MTPIDVGIVDSGICMEHPRLQGVELRGSVSFLQGGEGTHVVQGSDLHDEIGHGTAVASIVTDGNNVRLFSIKLFDDELSCTEDAMLAALTYLERQRCCQVVNISAGLIGLERTSELNRLCENLTSAGCYLIAAFDNAGGIAYPAAFDSVIGVSSGDECIRAGEIEFVEGQIVNILGRGGARRVAWRRSRYNFAGGTSFASAEVTQLVCRLLASGVSSRRELMSRLRKMAKCVHDGTYTPIPTHGKPHMRRAVLLPYNKEMQSVVRSADQLTFSIDSIHDVGISGNVGRKVTSSSGAKSWIIEGIDNIKWERAWDTLILGHSRPLKPTRNRSSDVGSVCHT